MSFSFTTRFLLASLTAALLILWAIYSDKCPGLFEKGMYVVCGLLAIGYAWKFGIPLFYRRTPIIAGGLYSTVLGRGQKGSLRYGVSKVLLHENGIVHLRIYKNLFEERPPSVEVSSLSLGRVGIDEFPGAGHMPLSESAFAKQRPVLLTHTEVEPNELAGYEEWKKQAGGSFNW